MSNTSAAPVARKSVDEIIGKSAANRAAQSAQIAPKVTVQQNAVAAIETNVFYRVMLDKAVDPEEKQKQVTKLLTFSGTKEENKERIKQFEAFHEYLQEQRKKMAVRIINLTDTETFSELQRCYNDMNTALVDFDNRMLPLTEIIDAIYELRTDAGGNKIFDTFKEIQDDKRKEIEHKKKLGELNDRLEKIEDTIRTSKRKIASLSEQKSFFGLGGIKQEARAEIAILEQRIGEEKAKLVDTSEDLRTLQQAKKELDVDSDFKRRKAKLRELLDLSSDTHNQRQKDLVKSALTFVQNASDRVGNVRSHLGQMGGQIDSLLDSNTRMSNIYAITAEALKDAEKENQAVRSQYDAPEGAESLTRKSVREEKRTEIDSHIRSLDSTAESAVTTYADINSQTMRIKTMKDANDDQEQKARVMSSQGISGVADRLSVVLQAVSSAAIGESSAMSKNTITSMVERTNTIAQKEAIRVAMGGDEINADIQKAIEDLATYGEIYQKATSIQRDVITDMRSNLDRLKSSAQIAGNEVRNAISINADIAKGEVKAVPNEADKNKVLADF